MIDELLGQSRNDPRPGLDLGEQQPAAVGADGAPFADARHGPAAQGVGFQLLAVTLCPRKVVLLSGHNRLTAQPVCQRGRPFFNPSVRYSG